MDNTFFAKIKKHCKDKNNYLCIGLDLASHISDIDEHDKINFIRDLSTDIIESTIEYCPFYIVICLTWIFIYLTLSAATKMISIYSETIAIG